MRKILIPALICLLPSGVNASLITSQPVSFNAPQQSLWGSGGAADFGASGSGGFGPVDFSYQIGASSGTVEASFDGNMSAEYTPVLQAPGTTSLKLGFQGDSGGGNLKSDLGAWVEVNGEFDLLGINPSFTIIDRNYALGIDENFEPQLDQQVSGSDSATIGGVGLDVFLAQVEADFDIEQTDKFEATAIDGILAYELRGSDNTLFEPFSLDTDIGAVFDIDLPENGVWDFWFKDMILETLFSTSFDAELVIWEDHRGCGFLGGSWCGENSATLADIDVYNGTPFALGFDRLNTDRVFSIEVGGTQIPEPATLTLMCIGLAGFLCKQRRSKAAT